MPRIVILLSLLLSLAAQGRELKFVGQESPAFNATVAGTYTGAMVEIAQTVCARLGHQCSFTGMPLLRALTESRAGRADAVLSLLFNDERSAYLNFTDGIIVSRVAFLGNPGAGPVRNERELDGYTVASVRGSTTLRMLEDKAVRLSKMRVVAETDIATIVQKLHAGRYGDKALIFGPQAMLEITAAELEIKTVPVLVADKLEFRIAFAKHLDAAVLAGFNSELQKLRGTGELARIARKYGLDVD
ncbi:transporter substrate-binding domain-containing protein [Rugamonas sp. FT82W]|uniref:Transporter substrate-binding domain-containing protein n=1 Tax=Duganella vulcania TaxID=2692166 RepID=A0A845G0W9_9BURK|nr:transporter substrate-binding domain-containing protein [Duganella vulcania]MYM87035.1 transporter substrate-binding domain-containing protein [Duganella vulcania]